MKARMKIGSGRAGLSLLELMVLVGVMALLAMIFLPYLARSNRPAARIKCVNNLKNVGLAFRIFATDNNDLFPGQVMASNGWHKVDVVSVYQMLSNELSTPKILLC